MNRVRALAALLLAVLAAPVAQAAAAPPSGPTTAVSLGDSYISGEAGRWQGNSLDSSPGNSGTDRACRPAGPGCQVDKSKVYVDGTDANGCHRSDVSEILTADLPVERRANIACSGAVTKNIFRASAGGAGQGGEAPQADQLLKLAQQQRVTFIVLSIGGNDLGFASIVQSCFTSYLSRQGPCEPKQQPGLDAKIPKATADVEKAIDEIRTVMTQAGYAAADYRLVVQTYPSVVPRAAEARYAENDPQRSDACPFYDSDLNWARDKASVQIGAMVKAAAVDRGTEVMDLGGAFQGHEFCSKTTQLATPADPPSPTASEWGRFLGPSSIQQGDTQELFHPNAYGQQAFATCLGAVAHQDAGRFACDPAAPGGAPTAMALRRVASVSPGTSPPTTGSTGTGTGSGTSGGTGSQACTSRRTLTVHVKRRFRKRLRSARVVIGGRTVSSFKSAGSGVQLDLRRRPAGTVVVRIVMRLSGGRTSTDTRRFKLCG